MYHIRKNRKSKHNAGMNNGKNKLRIISILFAVIVLLTLFPLTLPTQAASESITVETVEQLRQAVNTAPTDAVLVIQLGNDITLTDQTLTVAAGRDIILTSLAPETYTLLRETAGRHFIVEAGASLQLDNITLSGDPDLTIHHGGIEALGTLVMNAGATIENNRAVNGAGVDVLTTGTFTMNGGHIINNTATNGAGGTRVSIGSTFTMEDGLISGNSTHGAYGGGGVQVFGALFTMTGGRIEGNTAYDGIGSYSGVGGGVAVHNQVPNIGTFTMSGDAVIHDNQAENGGGGVAVTYSSIFNMNGGTVSDNTAINSEGGGVNVSQGSFIMTDGVIKDNRAQSGGGVWMFVGATFTMRGDAEISGNNAVNGGAVYIDVYVIAPNVTYADSLFTLEDGIIADNIAAENGGGVFITADNEFIMSGGSITQNTAGDDGGGVYLETDAAFSMSGGEITDNTATNGDGGGIFTEDHGGIPYPNPVPFLTAYTNIMIAENASISGNRAGGGHFFPPTNASESPFGDMLNNYEINFRGPYQGAQITFRLNGGNVDGDTADIIHSVPLGETIGDLNLRPSPQRTAYTLLGWTLGDDATILNTAAVDALDVASGMVFTAEWESSETVDPGPGPGDIPYVHRHFMIGYPNNTFRPNASITRAEVAVMLARTMILEYKPELPAPTGLSFTDVSETQWFYSYIAWGYAHDLIVGYPDGTFRPNAPITREELAAMITRASGVTPLPAGTFPFPDAQQIHPWARDYVYTAYRLGWIIGDASTLALRPLEAISRAETAAVFSRVLERGTTDMRSIQAVFYDLHIFPDASNQNSWFFFYVIEATHTHRFTVQDGVERWTAILWSAQS